MIVQSNLSKATSSLNNAIERMTTGYKINHAADNAAGYSIARNWETQLGSLDVAADNAATGADMMTTLEDTYSLVSSHLQRVRDLTEQAANGTYGSDSLKAIQSEVYARLQEVDRIASTAQFNGFKMLTGRFAEEGISFHIGANTDEKVTVTIGSVTASSLGLKGAQGDESNVISVASSDEANITIATIDEALKNVNKQRASLGATQNRMELAQKGINTYAENLQAAESRIRDTDFAETMVEYTKYQILSQSASAMLAQSNTNASLALQLLK